MRLDVAGRSDVGNGRSPNQDRYAIRRDLPGGGVLCVVADGMGGHASGDIAATLAVEYVLEGAEAGVDLSTAVASANAEIYRRSLAEASDQGMGTTVTCVRIGNGQAQFVHAGDSRMYLIRDGQSRQLTTDHSWVANEVRAGRATAEDARHSVRRNLITRALGLEREVAADTGTCLLVAGDALLLCSDGVHTLVSDDELVRACAKPAEEGSDKLLEAVIARGAPDNATVVIAKVLSDSGNMPRAAVTRPLPELRREPEDTLATGQARRGEGPSRSPRPPRRTRALLILAIVIAVLALAALLYITMLGGMR